MSHDRDEQQGSERRALMASGKPAGRVCPVCNNLDPRNHRSSQYDDTLISSHGTSSALPSTSNSNSKKRKRTASADATACVLTLPLQARDLVRRHGEQCRFCAVLLRALEAVLPDGARGDVGKSGERRGELAVVQKCGSMELELEIRWKKSVRIFLGGGGADEAEEMVEVYGARDRDLPWLALGSSHDVPFDPSSARTYDFIRQCLSRCESQRKKACVQWRCGDERPARLLELQDDNVTVKLVEGDHDSRAERYVALSHCWGDPDHAPLTTTLATAAARMQGIQLHDLPPLYQDAFEIGKTLGVRLLWIDSLCIIQDSPKDWQQESAKMAAIYSGAYLTIAATAAQDSSDRLLATRRAGKKVKYFNTKGDEYRLRARLAQNQHLSSGHFRPLGPLTSRGWTLQESLLSARILHYTATEVLFECRESSACECQPLPTPNSHLSSFFAVASTNNDSLSGSLWRDMVEKYSTRSIANAADKFAALSGVARALKPGNADYRAGLWTRELQHDLQWSTAPWLAHPHKSALPAVFRAPSWSWASIDAPVRYESFKSTRPRSLVHKLRTVPLPGLVEELWRQDPYGAMSGYFSLKCIGPAQEAMLVAPEDYDFYYLLKLASGRPAVKVFPDCLLVPVSDVSQEIVGAKRAAAGQIYQPFKAPVICLALTCDDESDTITGLVLGRQFDNTALSRLGLFSCGGGSFTGEERSLTIV